MSVWQGVAYIQCAAPSFFAKKKHVMIDCLSAQLIRLERESRHMFYNVFDADGPLLDTAMADIRYHHINLEPHKSPQEIQEWKRLAFKEHLIGAQPTQEEWLAKQELIAEFNRGILANGGTVRSDLMHQLHLMRMTGIWKFSIVTNAKRFYIDEMLSQAAIFTRNLFSPILTVEDHWGKTERIGQVALKWKVSPEKLVFITDTCNDVNEAQAILPMKNIVGVAWGHHSMEDLRDVGCIHIIPQTKSDAQNLLLIRKLAELHRSLNGATST